MSSGSKSGVQGPYPPYFTASQQLALMKPGEASCLSHGFLGNLVSERRHGEAQDIEKSPEGLVTGIYICISVGWILSLPLHNQGVIVEYKKGNTLMTLILTGTYFCDEQFHPRKAVWKILLSSVGDTLPQSTRYTGISTVAIL